MRINEQPGTAIGATVEGFDHATASQGGCKFRGRAAGRVVTGWGA
jgi:hypothetical protein